MSQLTQTGKNYTLIPSPAESDLLGRVGPAELAKVIQGYFNDKLKLYVQIDKETLEKDFFKLKSSDRQAVIDLINQLKGA